MTWLYLAVTGMLAAAYPFLAQVPRAFIFIGVAASSLYPVIKAWRTCAPENRRPWGLMAAALGLLNIGNVVWHVCQLMLKVSTAPAHAIITVGNVLMLVAALSVLGRRSGNDIGGLIDAAIVSTAVGGLLWDFVVLPYQTAVDASLLAQGSLFMDMFLLAAVLGALARSWLTSRERLVSLDLMVITIFLALAGTVMLAVLTDPETGRRPPWAGMVLLVGYITIGGSALHPSSRRILDPGPAPAETFTVGRLIYLGVALALIPMIGGGRVLLGLPTDGILLVLGSVSVIPLVMVRIGRLARQRAIAEAALAHQASHDALTGLPNRREFMARTTAALGEWQAGRRDGVVVLFCDLDGFKAVNDQLGHAAGDRLLVSVAERLNTCVRRHDLVGRFGGDEFLVLCDAPTAGDAAASVGGRISEQFGGPFEIAGELVVVGASVGAVGAVFGEAAEDLIRRADAAMYQAKLHKAAGQRVKLRVA